MAHSSNSGSVYSAVPYQYVSIEQLPKSTYDTIIKMMENGWVKKMNNGEIDLSRINKAYPMVDYKIIKELSEIANIDMLYRGDL